MMRDFYRVVGVMSGTSLDGLDLAFCEFRFENSHWNYQLKVSETIEYTDALRNRLKNAVNFSGMELALLNSDYGHFLGQKIRQFIDKNQLDVDLVSVHGHTIFHQPEKQLTLQIGDGAAIASYLKCPVVTQFRNTDVALGGQGAPLVPIGDRLLFRRGGACSALTCLNLGGIANISFTENEKTTAFDICVCNMALNYLVSHKKWHTHGCTPTFDENGNFAASGQINSELFAKLNNLNFLKKQPPKSLGFEWFDNELLPLLNACECSVEDKLRTVCEHIAKQISIVVNAQPNVSTKTMIITGGGAKNGFLISRIKHYCLCKIEETHPNIIDFKEALIFGFLGVLRLRGEVNCLSDVTGAKHDNVGGCVYLGNGELKIEN
ncbi:MAG: anhydro-N-acetylmuramic acid kinase [Bacteroidales bacterium]|jgi:anhydro-N-acetylmuramic acid kinase|nr:anhydro-N-acetylmuramic acid kinase [Bacteroidales bacterium]